LTAWGRRLVRHRRHRRSRAVGCQCGYGACQVDARAGNIALSAAPCQQTNLDTPQSGATADYSIVVRLRTLSVLYLFKGGRPWQPWLARLGVTAKLRSQRSTWLRLYESELFCGYGVEHPRRKKSGQSPVLESLLNDCVACLRFWRAECHMVVADETEVSDRTARRTRG